MKGEKFTFNSLILVVILITGIFFFFSVKVVEVAEHTAEFEFIPIEGTDLSVCYSNLRTNGIYSGDRVTGELVVPGDFGHDWGAAAEDGVIYINEYTRTSLNLMKCRIAKVEIDGFRKSVYMDDAMLRGRCASGTACTPPGARSAQRLSYALRVSQNQPAVNAVRYVLAHGAHR